MSRDAVYRYLLEREGEFLSGQEICQQLEISRTAVWKAIEGLRQDGCDIEARRGLGYCLLSSPDALTEREIRRYLSPETDCPQLNTFEEIDSTNSYLKREALRGAAHGTVAVANHQTAGRGRLSRSFQSPAGKGVYLSILLRPELTPEALMGVTGMAAVAAARAVERSTDGPVGIKWTNDLVLNGKKLCGILTEMSLEGETGRVQSLVIGVGVNVLHRSEDFSPEVAEIATSLSQEGCTVSRPALAAALVEELYQLGRELGGDLTPWVEEYRRRCVNLGREVRLLWTEGQKRGRALDIDDKFGLVVRLEDGTCTTVRTGEASVRGLYGYTD